MRITIERANKSRDFKTLKDAMAYLKGIGAKALRGVSGRAKDASHRRYVFKIFRTHSQIVRMTLKEGF